MVCCEKTYRQIPVQSLNRYAHEQVKLGFVVPFICLQTSLAFSPSFHDRVYPFPLILFFTSLSQVVFALLLSAFIFYLIPLVIFFLIPFAFFLPPLLFVFTAIFVFPLPP